MANAQSIFVPIPACSSGCPDADGDGFCDADERRAGIDLNGDGRVDAVHDLILPGSNPYRPDVYVQYDYMVLPDQGTSCTASADCNSGQRCIENVCRGHSHEPDKRGIKAVVDAFAAHGIALHIDPQHNAIPERKVTTLMPVDTACTGEDVVTVAELKEKYFDPKRKLGYHYAVFAHQASTPDETHAASCRREAMCAGKPDPDSTGSADLPGNDFIVSFGHYFDAGVVVGIETESAAFMHELGHNLGLRHGGPNDCQNENPNFISVMNYAYSRNGILVAALPGSTEFKTCVNDDDCSVGEHCTNDLEDTVGIPEVCYRLDYSSLQLPLLNEFAPAPAVGGLDERVGVSGPIWSKDIVLYWAPGPVQLLGASNGSPIDWNNDGVIGTHVSADINNDGDLSLLGTWNDWQHLKYAFQCTSDFAGEAGLRALASTFTPTTAVNEPALSPTRPKDIFKHPKRTRTRVLPF